MTKKQQDLAWACLPKKAREELKRSYKYQCQNRDYNRGFNEALEEVFNSHNLTSDTEPPELLYVERKKVQEYYSESENDSLVTDITEYDRGYALGIGDALGYLFGDKCLPDKEPIVSNNETKGDTIDEHPKPEFKVGQPVRVLAERAFGRIEKIEVYDEEDNTYRLEYLPYFWFEPSELEPYTEPESRNLSQETANCDKSENNQLKDNVEEKELDLCELLKGCEGEEFFSISVGKVIFKAIYDYDDTHKVRTIRKDEVGNEYNVVFHSDGRRNKAGLQDLYPSEDLLRKYPLDASQAWREWAESRKPKYVLQAQIRLISNDRKTVEDYENVEVEVSDIDLTEAAEVVREVLQKFHDNHTEQ